MKYTKELHDTIRQYSKTHYGFVITQEHATALLDEIERLQSENEWIPVSQPPPREEVGVFYLVSDFDAAETYSCGIPSTTAWYDHTSGDWMLPTGCGVNPTHYKKCISDNGTRVGRVHGRVSKWSNIFPKSKNPDEPDRWIPVSIRPDDDAPELVLCYAPQYHSIEIRWTDTLGEAVTHWRPLPTPPEAE